MLWRAAATVRLHQLATCMRVTLLWILCAGCSAAKDAKFTCVNDATLYVDGRYTDAFSYTYFTRLADDVAFIAIECRRSKAGKGGLIASLPQNIVTDKQWKCSYTHRNEWFTPDYDDTGWSNAYEIIAPDKALNASIDGVYYPPEAKWIWVSPASTPQRSHKMYCRRRLGAVKARVRCDDMGDIYLDGELVHSTRWWTDVWMASLSPDVSVVAIKCLNDLGNGGLIASFSNGIVSNRKWKCGFPYEGWNGVFFDDTSWDYACEIDNKFRDLDKMSAFPVEAKWIWPSDCHYGSEFHEIYCRVLLKKPELYIESSSEDPDGLSNTTIIAMMGCALTLMTIGCILFAILYLRRRPYVPIPISPDSSESDSDFGEFGWGDVRSVQQ